mgnify:CR=1 FL=1
MIEIKEIKNDSDLKKFVTFPFKLYKNSKYWIPPIISEEMNNFKAKNIIDDDSQLNIENNCIYKVY